MIPASNSAEPVLAQAGPPLALVGGHMGPLSHPATVNEAIRRFLERAYLPYLKSHRRPAAATAR